MRWKEVGGWGKVTEGDPATLRTAVEAAASLLSLPLALLAQNSLDIGTCHVERLESGPVAGKPHFPWDDLVACRATKLAELDGLCFLIGCPVCWLHLSD